MDDAETRAREALAARQAHRALLDRMWRTNRRIGHVFDGWTVVVVAVAGIGAWQHWPLVPIAVPLMVVQLSLAAAYLVTRARYWRMLRAGFLAALQGTAPTP